MTDHPDVPIAYIGGATYAVWDENGPDGHPAAHEVSVEDRTCTCENSQDNGKCQHLKVAVQAHPTQPDYDERLVREYAQIIASGNSLLNDLRDASAYMSGGAAETAETDAQPAADDGDGADDDDADDDDEELVDAAPNDAQEQLVEELQRWFDKAANFNDFDPEIIDLSWAETPDGRVGVAVERQPFSGGYYDDREWQDRDAFDEHRETAGDTVLSPRDEFEWFGEPEYSYWISEDDVMDLVGGDD